LPKKKNKKKEEWDVPERDKKKKRGKKPVHVTFGERARGRAMGGEKPLLQEGCLEMKKGLE